MGHLHDVAHLAVERVDPHPELTERVGPVSAVVVEPRHAAGLSGPCDAQKGNGTAVDLTPTVLVDLVVIGRLYTFVVGPRIDPLSDDPVGNVLAARLGVGEGFIGSVVKIALGIILALWLISKLFYVEVTMTLQ